MKGYASLWCEHLKKSKVRELKSKIMTWSKLKKHMDKRFLPPSYKQELYLKITSLNQENLKVEEYMLSQKSCIVLIIILIILYILFRLIYLNLFIFQVRHCFNKEEKTSR